MEPSADREDIGKPSTSEERKSKNSRIKQHKKRPSGRDAQDQPRDLRLTSFPFTRPSE